MSAIIVSSQHIDYLISAAVAYRVIHSISDDLHITRTVLERENARSVGERYGEPATAENIPAREVKLLPATEIAPVKVLKAIQFYAYQTCESPWWRNEVNMCEAQRFCEALRNEAIRRLPGYDDVPWGL